ncbi:MAG TPA: hypothetical protein VMB23_00035, partial [Spirochaetia bacterium]|nr:hypothetical protein [Spirochaetia bacterium]
MTLGGRSRTDGRWVVKTVSWTSDPSPPPSDRWPASGIRNSGLDFPAVPGWSVSSDEGRSWQPGESARTEAPSLANRKVLVIQTKKGGPISRFVYWLDPRLPSAPTLEFYGGWNPRVSFSGAIEALHRVTWTRADGKTQEDPEALWGPVGAWKV